MPGRDDKIYAEAAALWQRLYGVPPPAADGADILDKILGDLPRSDYQRLTSPFLRSSNITFPKR